MIQEVGVHVTDEERVNMWLESYGSDDPRVGGRTELLAVLATVRAEAEREALTKASADVLSETFAAGKAAGVQEGRDLCVKRLREQAELMLTEEGFSDRERQLGKLGFDHAAENLLIFRIECAKVRS